MKIYLIRHTEVAPSREICYGTSDIDLASTFTEEKIIVLEKLKQNAKKPIFYSSPLKRCRQLAEHLHANSTWPKNEKIPAIAFDERLKEIDLGEWELRPWKDLDMDQLTKWGDGFTVQKPHGGESYLDMQNRAMSFWKEIAGDIKQVTAQSLVQSVKNHIAKRPIFDPLSDIDTVVVTHGGVIRTLLSGILGLPLEKSFALEPAKGGISCIEVNSLGSRLLFFNH